MRVTVKRFIRKKSERGQSFVELAISIVFLLTLLAATIDLGWAFYTLIALRDAAQEAAVYGSMCPYDKNFIVERLQKSASAPIDMADLPYNTADPADPDNHITVCIVDPAVDPQPACTPASVDEPLILGNSVRVEAYIDHEIRTPFVANFIGTTSYPLRVHVSDAILRDHGTTGCGY
jgi:hypothetical protein